MIYTATGPPIFKLNLDILQVILRNLDTYSLAALGQTCRLFYTLVRRELNFESAVWQYLRPLHDASTHPSMSLERESEASYFTSKGNEEIRQFDTPVMPPVYHLRCMARVGNRLLMPFMTLEPVCFAYDITLGSWLSEAYPIRAYPNYTPFVTPVVSIGTRLYMFGGRQVVSSTLSNDLHVLDTRTWTLEKITDARGPIPRPRFDHSLDVLRNRYLVIFGGLCPNSPGENDVFLFDTETNTWLEPRTKGQIPTVRFGHTSVAGGDDLFIFGGSQNQPEGNMVHDVLYRLDCRTWTWYKYDHPEAYSYRRRIMSMDSISSSNSSDNGDNNLESSNVIEHSLRRDLIIETTGHPPRDRFHCNMQLVGPHKLVIFGGQTIRQDRDDNNVLHAYSLRSIDVFDFKRKHWSAVHTTSMRGENNTYPQDMTSFVLEDMEDGYCILVIGHQKVFLTATESSSGETNSDPPSSSFRRVQQHQRLSDVSQETLSTGSSSSAAVLHQRSPPGVSRGRPAGTTGQSTLLAPLTESPGDGDIEMTSSLAPTSSHWRRSRPFADYENFLDSSLMSSEEISPRRRQSTSHQSTSSASGDSIMTSGIHPVSPTYDSLPSFQATGPSGSRSSPEFNARHDPHRSRQYNVEPLSILLELNR